MRSLLFVEEEARNILTRGGKPMKRVELFDPPPAPDFKGVSFLEFAVENTSERALAGWLRKLGFRRAGRHRTKDVLLYRQADVNIVLNAERDSFAHAFYSVHGPSICAIALEVADELETLSRAEAFLCTRVDGRVGPNERTIPAVTALDGSLIYFVPFHEQSQNPLEIDFLAEQAGGLPLASFSICTRTFLKIGSTLKSWNVEAITSASGPPMRPYGSQRRMRHIDGRLIDSEESY
jgi:4-hydroxyphenylpyruvate dioxygenase